jgi:hypothetical protein
MAKSRTVPPMPAPEEPVTRMRVCVIGDSHTAALKAGWTSIAGEFAHADLPFFAARRELLVNLAVQDGALVPTDPRLRRAFKERAGGATRIEPRFDSYILCGMGSGVKAVLPLLSQHRPATIAPDGRQGLSNACYAACMARVLGLTPMMWLLGLLRQISDAPAALVATPASAPRPAFAMLAQRGEDAALVSLYTRAFESLAEPLGARFLAQPRETLHESVLSTDPVYFRGGEHLAGDEDDQSHANAEYGAIVLRRALTALTAQRRTDAEPTPLTRC